MNKLKAFSFGSVALVVLGVAYSAAGAAPIGTPKAEELAVCDGQPNMAAALASLHAAVESLNKAERNKGGWRAAALKSVHEAISQTEQGCSAAK